MVRKAVYSGQFYEKNEQELERQIVGCYEDDNGPGALPLSKRSDKIIKGIIAPHAGYQFSGPCAAWAYKEIAEAEYSDLYIIIGPNHSGSGNFTTMEGFETPFGIARVDQEFTKLLLEKAPEITINDEAQINEHSIEVQIPMLQYATRDKMHELKIVPIILSEIDYLKFGLDLKETIIESGKKVTVIVSSDFTHYGRNYHYVPFTNDVQKNVYDLDGKAIELIKILNPDSFVKYTDDKLCNICGIFPIASLLKMLSNTKNTKAELLHYYTSGDLEENKPYKNAVGYASILFS